MAYLVNNIEFKVYSDTSETEFPQQLLASVSKEFSSSTVTELLTVSVVLAGAGAQTINLNGVGTIKRWYLYSSSTALNVNMNSLGDVTYQAQEAGYTPITLSSLVITNASASDSTTVTFIGIAS